MDNSRTIELLWQMREFQVEARRNAVRARNWEEFRSSQSDIEIVDRAIADEIKLQKDWVASEAARLAQMNPGSHTVDYDPFAQPGEDRY